MPIKDSILIGEILVDKGVITPEQLEAGLKEQKKTGNRATTSVTLNIDKTPPTVTITATPNMLWPPNHKMVGVTVGGQATDSLSGITSTAFKVTDEYKTVEPLISGFNTTIQLESWRNGDDLDGRMYTISAIAKDKANNQASASTKVICPHDQGKR